MRRDSKERFVTPQSKGKAGPMPLSQHVHTIDGKDKAIADGHDDGTFNIPGRNGEPLEFYIAKMAEKNAQLEAKGLAPMMVEELIVVRLYSGPMYPKYNGVLRFSTGKESYTAAELARGLGPSFLQKQCETDYMLGVWEATAEGGLRFDSFNRYTTTIHALNSAIIKLSPLSTAAPVFRGISGASLPKQLLEADADNVCGGVEPGFTSTTTKREVAEFYAKVTKGDKASTIIEAEQGMIGRGADISWASQFTHEAETLFPPRMAIEILSDCVKGHAIVLTSRLTINMCAPALAWLRRSAHRSRLASPPACRLSPLVRPCRCLVSARQDVAHARPAEGAAQDARREDVRPDDERAAGRGARGDPSGQEVL